MRRLFITLATLILAGCGGGEPVDPGDPNDPDVSAVVYAPEDTSLYVGRSYQARPTVRTTSGDVFPGDHVDYESLDAAVSVSPDGVVTGQAIGRGRVVAIRGELRDTGWVSVVPEGTIAFNWYTNTANLAVTGLDGSVSWLAPTGRGVISGSTTWLADGRIVVERQDPALPPLLYLASPDGTVTTFFPLPPVGEPKAQKYPRASRDGQWVYFAEEEDLWRAHPDGTGLERITDTEWPVMDESPDPSPDGTRLLFLRTDMSGATPVRHIVRDLATGAEQVIPGLGYVPRWSPDGQWIAYWKASERFERQEIFVARADGSGERRVTAEGELYAPFGLDWSPDGAWLLTNRLSIIELVEVATGMGLPLVWANQGSDWASWRY